MDRLSESTVLVPMTGVVSEEIGKKALVLNLNGELSVLNETAALVWTELDGRHSLLSISEKLAKDYRLNCRTVMDDLRVLCRGLLRNGLIMSESSPRDVATDDLLHWTDHQTFSPDDIAYEKTDGGTVVCCLRTGGTTQMSGLAEIIWSAATEARDLGEIITMSRQAADLQCLHNELHMDEDLTDELARTVTLLFLKFFVKRGLLIPLPVRDRESMVSAERRLQVDQREACGKGRK
jgi:hypothetical protein